MYFFTTSLISLAVLRLIHGIGFGMITTSTGTIVASIIPQGRKGEGMGYYGLMMNISMALGPFVGLLAINQWGSTIMFTISAASVVIGTCTALLITLPKDKKKETAERVVKKKRLNMKDLIEMSVIANFTCKFLFCPCLCINCFVRVRLCRRTSIDRSGKLFLYCLCDCANYLKSIYRKMVRSVRCKCNHDSFYYQFCARNVPIKSS